MAAPDRKAALIAQNVVTGIDFVHVDVTQTILEVHFLRDPLTITMPLDTAPDDLVADQILIYNAAVNVPGQEVGIAAISWAVVGGDNVLRVQTVAPGDFTLYKFAIDDTRIDRVYNYIGLNFKANCPSDLDCKTPDHECAPEDWLDFPIDYQARDFDSFRQALSDFASQRYPNWNDRLAADAGIMLMEVMAAMGDEMSYYQDRIAREAHLETATQRRSVRRHARLLDYQMHDGLGASSYLEVVASAVGDIDPGTNVWAMSDDETKVMFEVGKSLEEMLQVPLIPYHVDPARNSFTPHSWDEDDVCLAAGSTEIYVTGHQLAVLRPGSTLNAEWLLLKTAGAPGIPVKTFLVPILDVFEDRDPVLGIDITRISWSADYATPFEMDLEVLSISANIVPIVAGERFTDRFIVGEDPDEAAMVDPDYGTVTRAIERDGPDDATIYLFSLTGSDDTPLVMEGTVAEDAQPAIVMKQVTFASPNWVEEPDVEWKSLPTLLGKTSAEPQDTSYTLDDGLWRRVVGYQRPSGTIIHQDYATSKGKTIRFGDGEFGLIPAEGTIFQVDYRLGNGAVGNVERESIVYFDSTLSFVTSVSNPFGASNGEDEESIEAVKLAAPEAFRAITYRAVRPEDYAEAAERLAWVQKAGATFRWTGSWLTGFVTTDPLQSVAVTAPQMLELGQQMDRFRQAGREVYGTKAVYANMDLEIEVCIHPDAFAAEVKPRIQQALFGKGGPRPVEGYFSPDRFTFGTPLNRTSLEATIQLVAGVKAVESIRIRRRGWFDWRVFEEYEYLPGDNVIVRLSNNLLYPEQGTLKLFTHGGA